ncbi:MAG TPA: heliorhodopsin HeR [Candidatus Saccharimonadales bacterium]|nr:heliorhodopsin HeR [Candidatus Saccharimonadales bacterium]
MAWRIFRFSLRRFNVFASLVLIIQAIILLFIGRGSSGVRPVTISYLTKDNLASRAQGQSVLAQASHHLVSINLLYLVAAFLLVSGVSYFLSATIFNRTYKEDLQVNYNRQRWIGLAVSTALMMATIALLVGIYDLPSLILIAGLTALAALLGLLLEVVRPANWLSFWFGAGAIVLPWVVIILYLWGAYAYGSSLPVYIYWLLITMVLLFASLIVNTGFQRQKIGHWENYLFGEKMSIVLNLIAQTALAWQIFAGTLH